VGLSATSVDYHLTTDKRPSEAETENFWWAQSTQQVKRHEK